MARMAMDVDAPESIESLAERFLCNKREFDAYKKIVDEDNAALKLRMSEDGVDKLSVNGYTIKRTVSTREELNEERAMQIIKSDWSSKHGSEQCPFIVTKEVLDITALENALYKGEISDDVVAMLDTARTTKEIVALRVSKTKKAEE